MHQSMNSCAALTGPSAEGTETHEGALTKQRGGGRLSRETGPFSIWKPSGLVFLDDAAIRALGRTFLPQGEVSLPLQAVCHPWPPPCHWDNPTPHFTSKHPFSR